MLITVVVATSTYFWMTSVQSEIQEDVTGNVESGLSSELTEFTIATTSCEATPNNISMILMNTGSVSISSGNAVISVSNNRGAVLDTILYSGFPVIGQEELVNLEATSVYNLVAGTTYSIRITIPGGKSMSDSCVAE